jgi:hypothetical protein
VFTYGGKRYFTPDRREEIYRAFRSLAASHVAIRTLVAFPGLNGIDMIFITL